MERHIEDILEAGMDPDALLDVYEETLADTGSTEKASTSVIVECEEDGVVENAEEIVKCVEKMYRRKQIRAKMKPFRSAKTVYATPYEEGMEDNFIQRYYNDEDVDDETGIIHTSGIMGEHTVQVPTIEDQGRTVLVGEGYVVIEERDIDGSSEFSSVDKKEFKTRYVSDEHPLMVIDTETNEITQVDKSPFESVVSELFMCHEDDGRLELKSVYADNKLAYVIGKCPICESVWKFSVKAEEIDEKDI